MQPAGRAEVDRVKADGRWERAYAGPATVGVPDDLITILRQIEQDRRPETRARRIEQHVAMLGRGETPYPHKRTVEG